MNSVQCVVANKSFYIFYFFERVYDCITICDVLILIIVLSLLYLLHWNDIKC
jgi:hypothetical protein